MHQLRLPLPSSTGRCRSSNVDSTRLFAKFGPRIKKREGGCQPARFAKCGVGWRKIGCEITPTASFIILFLSPLSLFLPPKVGLIWTDRDGRTERHLLAPSRAFYHRENLPASFICANWATTNLGLQRAWTTRFRFHEGSLVSFAASLPQRFESSIRGPFFAAADIALRFTALGPATASTGGCQGSKKFRNTLV